MFVVLLACLLLAVGVFSLLIAKKQSGGAEKTFSPLKLLSVSVVDDDDSMAAKLIRAYFSSFSYIQDVFDDTMEKAQERLSNDEIVLIMYVPPGFFADASSGAEVKPLEVWLNPRMPAESAAIGQVIRKYAAAVGGLYSNMYGFQRIFQKLTNNEKLSWERTTSYSVQTALVYLGRFRFAEKTRVRTFDVLRHTFAGLLMVLTLLPAFGVLSGTVRMAGTPLEDRLHLASGRTAPFFARLAGAFVWWLILVVPWLILLKAGGFLDVPWTVAAVLLSLMFGLALGFSALGRIKADASVLVQAGWFLFFVLLMMGGVLFPSSLFPVRLWQASMRTPLYPAMQAVYLALQGIPVPAASWWLACWPLALGIGVSAAAAFIRAHRVGIKEHQKGGVLS